MKRVAITVWPKFDLEDPDRDWIKQNLKDPPIERMLLCTETTKYGNIRETWILSISDHDALVLQLKYPTLVILP